MLVSHDRMFLDNVADVVYEIEYGTAKRYPGNYSHFVETKQADYEKQLKDYTLQQQEIKRLETLVERFKNKPTKVAMTRSKLKQIEHMVKIDAPARYDLKSFHADFQPARESVTDVLRATQLRIGYDRPLAEVTFEQKKGQKIGIIGDNGSGKSTLLHCISGAIPVDEGTITWKEQPVLDHPEVKQKIFLVQDEPVFAQAENARVLIEYSSFFLSLIPN